MSRSRTLAVLVAAGLVAGLAGFFLFRSPPGEDALPALAAGRFLDTGRYVDFRQRYRAMRRDGEARILPPVELATVAGGWGGLERWGIWGLGDGTELRFFVRFLRDYDLVLTCRAPEAADRPQTVTVAVNGRALATREVGTAWQTLRIPVPPKVLRRGDNAVELRYGFALDGVPGRDDRPLALAIESIGFLTSAPPGAAADETPAPARVETGDDALVLRGSGSLLVPLRVPPDARALTLEPRFLTGEGRLRASIRTLDGEEETVFDTAGDEGDDVGGRRELPLAGYRDRDVDLVFDVDQPPGARLALRAPRLVRAAVDGAPAGAAPGTPPETGGTADDGTAAEVGGTSEGTSGTPEVTPAAAAETDGTADGTGTSQGSTLPETGGTSDGTLPDVVLVVLDAARADAFGFAGYHRDTTPHLDRLAADALVFRQAVAECPYTVCSMPALLTGLSFLEHRLVRQRERLAPAVRTLAETLRERGYRTLGFTGNPNSSRATGSDQGFDEFFESWRRGGRRAHIHPRVLTRRVAARLARGDLGAEPLFLLVHYVPPHEPYDPDPEHDLFGDPGYDGPVTGNQRLQQAIFAGEVAVTDADVAELRALYDGNLRQADDAVARLVAALEDAGRWRDTLFLLTSDHGEAFLEHGSFAHNDTLYEEMLRVPMLVRLPGGKRPEGVDVERLVTLADVVPTVLGLAGGGDARAGLLDPAPPRDRLVFLRTAHLENTVYGVRGERFKLMTRVAEPGEPGGYRLYDLRADPGETQDLAPARRLAVAGLALRLERALGRRSRLAAEASELTAADEEMLRSLGYL